MFNLSGSELVVIMLLALVVLGPDRLPDAMRKAGKMFGEFKKLTSGFQDEVRKGFEEPMNEVKQTAAAVRKAAAFTTDQRSSASPKQRYNPNVDPKPILPPGSSVAEPADKPDKVGDTEAPDTEIADAEITDTRVAGPEIAATKESEAVVGGADAADTEVETEAVSPAESPAVPETVPPLDAETDVDDESDDRS